MMPGMDGFEVTRRLRDAGRTYPGVFLTAKDATEDKVAGLGAGVTTTSPSRSRSMR